MSLSVASQAGIITSLVTMTGPNESPANTSPGTGTGTITIDTVLNTMRVQASFSGLTTATTAAHIHCCTTAPGTGTANVATALPTFPNFPLGVTSGTYDMTFDLLMNSSYNPAFVSSNGGGTPAGAEAALIGGIVAGDAYLNIHTNMFPNGEIRGFLLAVPEPGTMMLLSVGLGACLLKWSNRRA
jgi:hypothetical protein